MFDQLKAARDLLKNINPADLPKLMEQAKESQKMLEEQIRKIVREELAKLNLPTKEEIEELKNKILNKKPE